MHDSYASSSMAGETLPDEVTQVDITEYGELVVTYRKNDTMRHIVLSQLDMLRLIEEVRDEYETFRQ